MLRVWRNRRGTERKAAGPTRRNWAMLVVVGLFLVTGSAHPPRADEPPPAPVVAATPMSLSAPVEVTAASDPLADPVL